MAPTVAPETHRNPTLKELKGALSPCYDCANEKGGCTASCPSGLPIADMIRLLLKNGVLGKYAAASLAMNANPIGTGCAEACGDHCDAEKGCRQRLLTLPLQELHAEVAQFFAQNLARFPLEKVKLTDKRVAIVGDGPAALSAALFLAASGVEVTIVSNTPTTPGGLLKNIPRVSAESLEAIQSLLSHFSDRITITHERPDLNGETPYNGVILATGLEYKIPLQPLQEGRKDRCSHAGDHAVQFIREHQVDQNTPLQGQIVAIVGGGKTAVDAALLAQRLGATVTVYYRRDFGSMEGREEILKTGIEIQPLLRPTQSFETGDKKIHLSFEKMKVAMPNTRLAPEEKREVVKDEKGLDPGICADMVLWATPGKNPDLSDLRTWAGEKPVIDAGDIADGDHPRTVAGAVGSAQRAVKELAGQLNIELQPIIRPPRVNTSVEFAGKTLTTPFIVAAVPTSDAANLTACRAALSQNGCSGMVIKTVSFDDQHIAMPAGYMVDAGDGRMGNADHISRAGITQAIETLTTLKKEFPGKLIGVSIMSPTIEGWGTLAKQLQNAGADFVECSFSCPQGNMTNDPAQKGQMLGQNPEAACRAARAMIEAVGSDFPVSIKIPTSNTAFVALAKALYDAGIRYITCANSVHGIIPTDLEEGEGIFKPGKDNIFASVGFTGEAITAASLASVHTLREALQESCPDLKIMGTGGMMSGKDMINMLAVGADLVQVGTAIIERGVDVFEEAELVLAYYLHVFQTTMGNLMRSAIGKCNFDRMVQSARLGSLEPTHDEETCVGCGNCATTCNEGMHTAMSRTPKGQYTVDPNKCESCGACEQLCPTGAITMEPRT